MRTKRVIQLLACTGAAGALAVAAGYSAAQGGGVPDDVKEKQAVAALGRTLSADEEKALIDASGHLHEIGQEDFHGSSEDVSAIEATVPAMVARLNNLQDLPQAAAIRQLALPTAISEATAAAKDIFAPQVLTDQLATLIAGIRERATVPNMEMMQKAEVGPATFQRINVTGDTAEVAFTATSRRLTEANGWIEEGRSQWQLTLVRTDGRWLLVKNSSLNVDGGEG